MPDANPPRPHCYTANCTLTAALSVRLVLETLTPLPGDRKCFRMINGVLVERTVKDVLPALQTNSDGLKKVLDELVKQYKRQQEEMDKWKVRLNFALTSEPAIICCVILWQGNGTVSMELANRSTVAEEEQRPRCTAVMLRFCLIALYTHIVTKVNGQSNPRKRPNEAHRPINTIRSLKQAHSSPKPRHSITALCA